MLTSGNTPIFMHTTVKTNYSSHQRCFEYISCKYEYTHEYFCLEYEYEH